MMGSIFGKGDDFVMPQMSYTEAMDCYGSDKPDLRFGLKHAIVTDVFKSSSFEVFAKTAQNSGLVKGAFLFPFPLVLFQGKKQMN